MEYPKSFLEILNTEQQLQGGVFSGKKSLPPTNYKILYLRWGSGTVVNLKELRKKGESSYEHPTIELLVKNDSMSKSRWTLGFPVREINLKNP